jgi:cysteine desulfurase
MTRPKLPIYLDYQATTPVDPAVLEAMLPYFSEHFGNASSSEHRFGWAAEEAVNIAREKVGELIGAQSTSEIIFTSGATESNNLAILGLMRRQHQRGNHMITLVTEHKAVLDPCLQWQREGGTVTVLPVKPDGLVDLDQLEQAIQPQTVLISIMAANNEIGVIQPLAEIGALAKARGIFFHTDAAQAVGKMPLNVVDLGIDLLSLSGHKLYAPKGIGALYVRRRNPRVSLSSTQFGGAHERGMRPGTLNVPGIVALGKACELAGQQLQSEQGRLTELRQHFLSELNQQLPGQVKLNGHATQRLAGNLSLTFDQVDGEKLLIELRNLAVSARSACTSGSAEPSHVLQALGLDADQAKATIRIGLGRPTTKADVTYAVAHLAKAVASCQKQLV